MINALREGLSKIMEQITKEYVSKIDIIADMSGQLPSEFKSGMVLDKRVYKISIQAVECESIEAAKEKLVQWGVEEQGDNIKEAINKSVFSK